MSEVFQSPSKYIRTSFQTLVTRIGACFDISMDMIVIFYYTKQDKTKYLGLKGQYGLKMIFQLKTDVDIFLEDHGPIIPPPSHISNRLVQLYSILLNCVSISYVLS